MSKGPRRSRRFLRPVASGYTPSIVDWPTPNSPIAEHLPNLVSCPTWCVIHISTQTGVDCLAAWPLTLPPRTKLPTEKSAQKTKQSHSDVHNSCRGHSETRQRTTHNPSKCGLGRQADHTPSHLSHHPTGTSEHLGTPIISPLMCAIQAQD